MTAPVKSEPLDAKAERLRDRSNFRTAMLMGGLAWLTVLLTLDGPGLTVDEPLDVRPGRTYLNALWTHGWHFFDPVVVDRVFRDNSEHPPLGRWLLGIASVLGEPFEVMIKGPDPTGYYVTSGRVAPALAFGLLVGIVTAVSGRNWGQPAGIGAGFALMTMPRVFSHAHLGALDTFVAFFWTVALLVGDRALRSPRPVLAMAAAGVIWSLALLTKIHGWFLLPLLGAWSFVRLPVGRAFLAVFAWSIVGVSLFVLGWPWLWFDSWARLWAYWGTGIERATIRVLYFDQVFADRDVPWHYPWVYFAITVPVGLHVLGSAGVLRAWNRRRSDRLPFLLGGSILLFLSLFSTRVPVYDGERLFLNVFPAWAMLIGLGFGWLWDHRATGRFGRIALGSFLVMQAFGVVVMYPFGLSYYNLMVGGLPGATRMGLERTYWSDAVDNVLLNQLAHEAHRGATASLLPTLYPGQGAITTGFNRLLAVRDIILQDDSEAGGSEWVVVSNRTAYWHPRLVKRFESGKGRKVAIRSRLGIELSSLWHFPRPESKPLGDHSPSTSPGH